MAISREKKQEVIDGLADSITKTNTLVIVGFTGISVNESHTMRSELFKENVAYKVVKKTLLKRAFEQAGTPLTFEIPGEVGVVFGDDMLAPARLVGEQHKALGGERLSVLGGIFEGKLVDASVMEPITLLPSIGTLHTQFVSLLQIPIVRFARTLSLHANNLK